VGDLDKPHLSVEIAIRAGRQHGHITRAQLMELRVSGTTIDRWCRSGRLVRVHAGVYALGYRRVEPIAITMAAVLACGPGAVASHDSAAAIWGWRRWPRTPEVTSTASRRRPGIRHHRTRSLPRLDRGRELAVPITSPLRTITDLRPRLTLTQFTRIVNDARRERRLTDEHVNDLLGYCAGPTRSEFEDDFILFCRRYGLPQPRMGATVAGYQVDALFAEQRVVVELDGWPFHNDRTAFVTDRERDAALLDAGYLTIRITRDRTELRPAREAARLRRILARRAA
jgi:Transcriptional regulator, AbiEi antitoxin/Protein of unknown function (DUF559)